MTLKRAGSVAKVLALNEGTASVGWETNGPELRFAKAASGPVTSSRSDRSVDEKDDIKKSR